MIPHHEVIDKVVALLDSEVTWPVGDTTAPTGASPPYLVVNQVPPTASHDRGWRGNLTTEWIGVQVTAVGVRADQARLVGGRARDAMLKRVTGGKLLDVSGTGWKVIERRWINSIMDVDGTANRIDFYDLLAAQ